MATANNRIAERLERAESEQMDTRVVSDDPLVFEVTNEASDRVHTVVPESVHCSCEDHTYRGAVCKHMLALLLGDHADPMADALDQEAAEATERLIELNSEAESLQHQIASIDSALALTDSEQSVPEDWEPAVPDNSEQVEIQSATADTSMDEFDSMVAKLTED